MIKFLSNDVKFYTVAHSSGNNLVIGVVKEYNTIHLIKSPLHDFNIINVDYYRFLPYFLKKNIHEVSVEKLNIVELSGGDFCLFVEFSYKGKSYVYQLNLKNSDVYDITPIRELYATHKIYLGYSDVKSITYTDNKQTTIHIRGLLYIDTDNPSNINGKYIRRIPVYMSTEEKEQLKSEGLIETYTEFPIVDNWSKQYPVVMKLPDNIKDSEFDFSTGMGKLTFSD